MVKAEAITGIALNGSGSQNCSACRKGKQTWNIIPWVTQEQSTKVLGQVFSDICGPIETTSIEGYQYFITFTNNYSQLSECMQMDGVDAKDLQSQESNVSTTNLREQIAK